MFPESTEPELEVGFLRSGIRFRLGKRIKTVGGRRTPSMFEESEYEVESHTCEGGCVPDDLLRKWDRVS